MRELHFKRSAETLTITLGEYHDDIAWADVALAEGTGQRIYEDAGSYGHTLFERIFRNEQVRSALLEVRTNERLVLVAEQPEVAAIPWEYLRDSNGMLVAARLNMVRGLPEQRRRAPVALSGPLHLIAVPSSPVDELRVLNTEREWGRLVEVVNSVAKEKALTLTRVRPPTLSKMEQTLSGQGMTLLHFMGHSGIANRGTAKETGVLAFEDQLGRSQPIDAAYFADALDASVFLVVLNSCLSAVVSLTAFGNIAHALVEQGVPYALGMQFVLLDDVALEMSKILYTFLLQGRSVEEAVRRTRRSLEQQTHLHHPLWLAGIPVLYTNQREPAALVTLATGQPTLEPDPKQLQETCDVTGLPQAEHFVGRGEQMSEALKHLLAADAYGFVLFHGLGGIGKTTLARAVAERVSWYYHDHVLALSFETFARVNSEDRIIVNETFADGLYNRLARYYGLDPSLYQTPVALQQALLQKRMHTRSLLVLDNLETLVGTLAHGDERAKALATPLATFISRLKEGDGAILLTSRSILPVDWGECSVIHLSGLKDDVGAQLFLSLVPEGHRSLAPVEECVHLSRRVQGHPLSIRLLAKRFAELKEDLAYFLAAIENELSIAEQSAPASLEDPERQKTLYACMHYSFQRLTAEQQQVLSTISIFLAPFIAAFAAEVLDDEEHTPTHLQELEYLGLLESTSRTFAEGRLDLFELHSMLRWYLQQCLAAPAPETRERYGQVYAKLAAQAYQPTGGADQSVAMSYLIRQSLPDCEAAFQHLPAAAKSALAYHLAKPYQRMGNVRRALALYERALETYQERGDVRSIAVAQSAMADLLAHQGRPQEAMKLYERALETYQELGDVRSIAVTQHAMAELLAQQGRPQEAMTLYEQSLQTKQELGDVRSIAVTQHAMADLLAQQGRPQEAMTLYEQSLHTYQELGDVRSIAITRANFAQLLFQQGEYARALSLAWHAYTSLDEHGYTRDAQLMQGILASLKEQLADTATFATLWEEVVHGPQPDWLRAVLPGE